MASWDSREFGTRVFWAVALVGAATVAADLFYHKHGHYPMEEWIGFHAVYGFVSCVGLVLAAKSMRRLLKRDEDYYD